METIVIAGGSGLIGNALTAQLLKKGYRVIILTRSPEKYRSENASLSYAKWDIEHRFVDLEAIQQADHIMLLAGASVAEKRWTQKRKKEIVDSRVKSSELLFDVLKENDNKVRTMVCASAIGWYGGQELERNKNHVPEFVETDPPATDFFGETCRQWEAANYQFNQLKKRTVILRIGIVLSADGGFLKEFEKPLRFGIAPVIGSGSQIVSWVHIEDLVRIFVWAMENEPADGVYNAVATEPTSFKKLILGFAESYRKRFFIPIMVPAFLIRIISGELGGEILKSVRVTNAKLKSAGFTFLYPHISGALKGIVDKKKG